MKILIATFDHNYYLWQCLVQINNFIKYGYDEDSIYIISTINPSPVLQAMMNHPKIKSKFYLYKDERKDSLYPSSLRPHILEKFFLEHPEYEKQVFFYTDPDVLFTKKLDFSEMLKDDTWYLSDTRGYIDSKYLKSRSEYVFNKMCEIVNVSTEDIIALDDNAGGAHYLLKGINANFWKKVYDDCEKLYKFLKDNEESGVLPWTADMWSVLWNGVYFNYSIKIHKDLDFCWAPFHIDEWYKKNIFHNAGIMKPSDTHFTKTIYQNSPFNQEIKVSENNCTFKYVEEIKETENNFKDIVSVF